MKDRYENSRKDRFISQIPVSSIDSPKDQLTAKCKFNFAYFHKDPAGQSFDEWNELQVKKLLQKLTDYSKESLRHWQAARIGGSGGTVLAIYGSFPRNSDFTCPAHVPHQAHWGRFRLENAVRLVGFILPPGCHDKEHPGTKVRFDCNTFYVVFLDANHRFYKTENK